MIVLKINNFPTINVVGAVCNLTELRVQEPLSNSQRHLHFPSVRGNDVVEVLEAWARVSRNKIIRRRVVERA